MKFLNSVYLKDVSKLGLDTTNTVDTVSSGEMVWNQEDGTLNLGLYNGVTLQQGQEIHVYGKASGTIANGDVVQFAGAQGDHILIKKAVGSEIKVNPHLVVGIATQAFTNNQYGYVTWFGKVHDLNTNTYPAGTILYFDCATSALINTVPVAPNPTITMCAVLRQHGTQGSILVRPEWGYRVDQLNDVHIDDIQDGEILIWNDTNGRWENGNLTISAANVSIVDVGNYYTSENLEDAFQETGNLLENAIYGSDPITGDPIPVDADTLEGHSASYFATAEQVANLSSAAEDITITDTVDYYTSTNVEGALAEIGSTLANLSAAAEDITIIDSGDYFTSDNVEDALQEVAAPKGIQLYDQVVDTNFTIPGTNNALSVGPITIADGVTVTVEDGATWTVV